MSVKRTRKPRVDLTGQSNDHCTVIRPSETPLKFIARCRHCSGEHEITSMQFRRNAHPRICSKFKPHNKLSIPKWLAALCRKYNVGPDELLSMAEAQNNQCAICEIDVLNTEGRRFAVDHDHITGKVRGLLCSKCNMGLGKFNDSPELIDVAIEYLEASK